MSTTRFGSSFPATPIALIGSIMSTREEHHSGKLMGEIKKGKSIIILTIRKGKRRSIEGKSVGFGAEPRLLSVQLLWPPKWPAEKKLF